jgi:hypothetical protein
MKKNHLCLGVSAGAWLAASCAVAVAGPTPVWEFKFDDAASGVRAINTGSDPNAANAYLTMKDASGATGNFRVSGGVSGRPGDMAFSSATTGLAHFAVVPGANAGGIGGFNKVTVSGWYKATQPVPITPNYVRIFLIGNRNEPNWDEGMVVDFNPQNLGYNQLGFEVNDYYNRFGEGGGDGYAGPVTNDTNVWHFWAITYDGTQTANNVKVYMGTTSASTAMVGTAASITYVPLPGLGPSTNPTGIIKNTGPGADFVLSANSENSYNNGFIGLQDDIRVYNSVLTLSDIESIRVGDVAPEPASLSLLGLGGIALMLRRRRFHHRLG